jgi:hypothetical protein
LYRWNDCPEKRAVAEKVILYLVCASRTQDIHPSSLH